MANENANNSSPKSSIDDNLKRVYEELSEEKLPDRFTELLERLKHQSGQQGGAKK